MTIQFSDGIAAAHRTGIRCQLLSLVLIASAIQRLALVIVRPGRRLLPEELRSYFTAPQGGG